MTDRLKFTAATDKDIYDLLMSSRQRMNEAAVRIVATRRGLIYSPQTSRDAIISEISLLPHDYRSLSELIKAREGSKRQEKMTCVTLPVELSRQEMGEIVRQYQSEASSDEEVSFQPRRGKDVFVAISYDEIDYSKTRLIQRQRRDAEAEFITDDGKTTIRVPATEKGKLIAEKFKHYAERIKTEKLTPMLVELSGLTTNQKTDFFLDLMRGMSGYDFETVVNMKVAKGSTGTTDERLDVDVEPEMEVSEEVVGIVSSVVIAGINLEHSDEYQSLRRKGYYFTSVTWRAAQQAEPRDLMQFEVSFENGQDGTGFRYAVRVARRLKKTGELTDKFEHLEANRQPSLWRLIETTALRVVEAIRSPKHVAGATAQEAAQ